MTGYGIGDDCEKVINGTGMLACPHARNARVDSLGALHPIIIRGVESKPIFKDRIDYAGFIDQLSKV